MTSLSLATLCLFALPVMALTTSFGMALLQLLMLLTVLTLGARFLPWYLQQAREWRWLGLAFAGYFLLSAVRAFAAGPGWAGIDGPSRMLLALSCIGFVGVLRPKLHYFWLGLCLGTIGAGLLALVQKFYVGMVRVDGYTHHPITFGNLALLMGLMSLCALPAWQQSRLRYLPPLALAAGLLASVLSASRGGWLALFLLAPLLLLARGSRQARLVWQGLAGLALAVLALCLLPGNPVTPRIALAFTEVQQYWVQQDATTSVGIRLELWKASWLMFAEHPWLGVGRDAFHSSLQELAARGLLADSPALEFASSHNDALHFLATGGLLDFSFLLMLYGAPLAFFLRYRRGPAQPCALAGLMLVLSFIGFGLTDVMFWLMMPKQFYVMMVCVLAGFCLACKDEHDK